MAPSLISLVTIFFFFKRCLEERVSQSGSAPSRCLVALAENVADAQTSGGIRMMSAGTARRSSVVEVGRKKKHNKQEASTQLTLHSGCQNAR